MTRDECKMTSASAFKAAPAHRAVMWIINHLPFMRGLSCHLYAALIRRLGLVRYGYTYFGSKMLCDPNDLIDERIFLFGVWEPDCSHYISEHLKSGEAFVDVGANIGYVSLLASKLVGPTGKVISIEASPAIYSILRKNIDINCATNVRLINKAAYDKNDVLTLYKGPRTNRGTTSTSPGEEATEVECKVAAEPIDAMLTSDELSKISFIKIDIEGGEMSILRRLLRTLDAFPALRCLLVEITPKPELQPIFDQLLLQGFEAFGVTNIYDRKWYIRRTGPEPLVPLKEVPLEQTDVLFVRRAVEDTDRRSPPASYALTPAA